MTGAESQAIRAQDCASCGAALDPAAIAAGALQRCRHCGTRQLTALYPTLWRRRSSGDAPRPRRSEGETACYFHAENAPECACADCGRYICALCAITADSATRCPACTDLRIAALRGEQRIGERVAHEKTALGVAALPFLFPPITLVTAPIALYLSIRHWRTPSTPHIRTRLPLAIAFFLAGAQSFFWLYLFGAIFLSWE